MALCGNSYRVIACNRFAKQTVHIKALLTPDPRGADGGRTPINDCLP